MLNILSLLKCHKAELSILLVDNEGMKGLNAAYRGVNETTDVLSFLQLPNPKTPELRNPRSSFILGDVVINIQMAALRAEKSNDSFYSEVSHLFVHGILHLLGYEHEKSRYKARKMRGKEQEILSAVKKMD